jgi:hypothetical protein
MWKRSTKAAESGIVVVWSGWGFAVAVVGILGLFFGIALFHESWWSIATGFLLAAAGNFGLARLLAKRKERVLVDPATRQEVVVRQRDSLFYIPVRFWSAIYLVLGLVTVGFALSGKQH